MLLSPQFRKLLFTAHITFSIGWFGAVAGFLILAITGLRSENPEIIRSANISMNLLGWYIIVPFCIGSFLTGLIQALFTQWGLFKHYWILVKFLLTIGATFLLMLHLQDISYMADVPTANFFPDTEINGKQVKLTVLSAAALLYLLVTIVISVYKPWGMTSYWKRKQQEEQQRVSEPKPTARKSFGKYIVIGIIILALVFIIRHLLSGGSGRH
jgi:hypothetical protein